MRLYSDPKQLLLFCFPLLLLYLHVLLTEIGRTGSRHIYFIASPHLPSTQPLQIRQIRQHRAGHPRWNPLSPALMHVLFIETKKVNLDYSNALFIHK